MHNIGMKVAGHSPTTTVGPRRAVLPRSTPLPNVFTDRLLPLLSRSETAVFLAVWRKTVGWDKIADWISLSQLQKATGLSRNSVLTAVAFWQRSGVLRRTRRGIRGTCQYQVFPGALDALASTNEPVQTLNECRKGALTGGETASPLAQPLNTQKKYIENGIEKAVSLPSPSREQTRAAVERRRLKEMIANCKDHLKNRRIPSETRERLQRELTAAEQSLAVVGSSQPV